MRTRQEIEVELNYQRVPKHPVLADERTIALASLAINNLSVLSVEILLDIRDLLTPKE